MAQMFRKYSNLVALHPFQKSFRKARYIYRVVSWCRRLVAIDQRKDHYTCNPSIHPRLVKYIMNYELRQNKHIHGEDSLLLNNKIEVRLLLVNFTP